MLISTPVVDSARPLVESTQLPAATDENLLAQVLGPPGKRARDAARDLLGGGPFRALLQGSMDAPDVPLTRTQARRLAALVELASRADPDPRPPRLSSPVEVYRATADLRGHRREHFLGLYLNARHRLLCRETISVGSLNASIVHPREVFEPALRHGAASLVVVHNHPSGETDPSDDDLAITRRLVEAGEILGVPVVDHVIVGWTGFTSLREEGHL